MNLFVDIEQLMKIEREILMIEPLEVPSEEPVIDDITKIMTEAWRSRISSTYNYMGSHRCVCGRSSDSKDHWVIPTGRLLNRLRWVIFGEGDAYLTNILSIHYLAYHRTEVPEADIARIKKLNYKGINPTIDELHPPKMCSVE